MKRCIRITVFLAIVLAALSCFSRKNEIDKSDIIPERKLPDIIADIYLTDGLLKVPGIKDRYELPDSTSEYKQVLENHGYTQESFDRSIRYYFIKRPRQFQKIYDKALAKLSEIESKNQLEVNKAQNRLRILWKGGNYYAWPGHNEDDSTSFNILLNPGTYTASFSLTLFPDDQSLNPRFFAYMTHIDSIRTGRKTYVSSMVFIKDGKTHKYTCYFNAVGTSKVHLEGFLFYHDNLYRRINKHMIIEDISISSVVIE